MSRLLMLDIETAPIDGVEQYLGNLKPRAGWKDAAKIKEDLEKRSAKERDNASLDPDLCRVVALAFVWESDAKVQGGAARTEDDERKLLTRFWQVFQSDPFKPRICGFNVSGFDVPVLLRRSQFLHVPAPSFRLGRYAYQMPGILDLQNEFTLDRHEKFEMRSKDWWLKRTGLADKVTNPCSGADVGALIALGDFDTPLAHCKADVAAEVLLAQWLGLWPESPAVVP